MVYAFVNEKIVNGKKYRAYRNTENPRDCIIESEDGEMNVDNLRKAWSQI